MPGSPALAPLSLRRRCGRRAGGGAEAVAARRSSPLSARPRRSRAGGALPRPAAGASARSDAARRHAAGGRSDPRRIARRERIAIHGDYDVDGITSTVILRRALELLGRRGRALHPRAVDRWLRPPAGGDRAAARAGGGAGHLGRLRHPRRRGGGARARTGRRSHRHRPSRAGRDAAAGVRGHQSEASRLLVPGQVPGRRRRRAEGRAGAVSRDRPRELAAGIRQDRRDRDARRRRAARRREPRHREDWARSAVAWAAQGRAAGAARRVGPDRQDDRQLSHLVHGGAAGQRRWPHEHARPRDAAAARQRRGAGRRSARARTAARRREHPPAGGGSRDSRGREESRPDRSGRWRTLGARGRRRRLASRRHRHRGVEAGRRLPSARDRAVGRRRGGPRLVPEHSGFRHARGARTVRRPVHPLRRPQAGRRADDGARRGSRNCGTPSTKWPTRRSARTTSCRACGSTAI